MAAADEEFVRLEVVLDVVDEARLDAGELDGIGVAEDDEDEGLELLTVLEDDSDEDDVVDKLIVKGDGVLDEGDETVDIDKPDETVKFAETERLCVEVEPVEITEVDPIVEFAIEETVDDAFVDKAADIDELACDVALDVETETLCDEEDATDDEEGDTEVGVYPFEVGVCDPDGTELMFDETNTDELETSEDVVVLELESEDDAEDDPCDDEDAVTEGEYGVVLDIDAVDTDDTLLMEPELVGMEEELAESPEAVLDPDEVVEMLDELVSTTLEFSDADGCSEVVLDMLDDEELLDCTWFAM